MSTKRHRRRPLNTGHLTACLVWSEARGAGNRFHRIFHFLLSAGDHDAAMDINNLSRRTYLKLASATAVGFMGLRWHGGLLAVEEPALSPDGAQAGYGPLVKDPAGQFDLPQGFSYHILSTKGDQMQDGLVLPGMPDGMAAFAHPDGHTVLVRNHELSPGSGIGPLAGVPASKLASADLYDDGGTGPLCDGGTTTLVYDTVAQQVLSQHLSLGGTVRNCAGGATPWGSWITCEESVLVAGENKNKYGTYLCAKDHGYNFEVPALGGGLVEPVPLKAMGRFNHEAVAIDPNTGIVYQTEDRSDGLIYRFIPAVPGDLAQGGQLQALAVVDRPRFKTDNWRSQEIAVGESLRVHWIDMEDVESPQDDLRKRGFKAGAARFARGEGMWYSPDGIYFACTNGGERQLGQIFKYVPGANEGQADEAGGSLTLFAEPNDSTVVENADNLTVAPWGDVILCEDRSKDTARLIGIRPDGQTYVLSQSHHRSELCGACFSPDGSTLFFNVQYPGLTVAITGPFQG